MQTKSLYCSCGAVEHKYQDTDCASCQTRQSRVLSDLSASAKLYAVDYSESAGRTGVSRSFVADVARRFSSLYLQP